MTTWKRSSLTHQIQDDDDDHNFNRSQQSLADDVADLSPPGSPRSRDRSFERDRPASNSIDRERSPRSSFDSPRSSFERDRRPSLDRERSPRSSLDRERSPRSSIDLERSPRSSFEYERDEPELPLKPPQGSHLRDECWNCPYRCKAKHLRSSSHRIMFHCGKLDIMERKMKETNVSTRSTALQYIAKSLGVPVTSRDPHSSTVKKIGNRELNDAVKEALIRSGCQCEAAWRLVGLNGKRHRAESGNTLTVESAAQRTPSKYSRKKGSTHPEVVSSKAASGFHTPFPTSHPLPLMTPYCLDDVSPTSPQYHVPSYALPGPKMYDPNNFRSVRPSHSLVNESNWPPYLPPRPLDTTTLPSLPRDPSRFDHLMPLPSTLSSGYPPRSFPPFSGNYLPEKRPEVPPLRSPPTDRQPYLLPSIFQNPLPPLSQLPSRYDRPQRPEPELELLAIDILSQRLGHDY